jgi:serine O-acetyltransferase
MLMNRRASPDPLGGPEGVIERLAGHAAAMSWHAIRLQRLAQRLWAGDHRALAVLVAAFNRFLTGVDIPPSAHFGDGLMIMHGNGIVVHFMTRAGERCTIYQGVTLGARSPDGHSAPTLGDDVTIYPGAVVLGNITIGDGATIGANAVVISDVPPGGVVVGALGRLL